MRHLVPIVSAGVPQWAWCTDGSLSVQSAGIKETLVPEPIMLDRLSLPEPNIHVSARFRLTLESTILDLEAGARHDERVLRQLQDPDHRRRQRLRWRRNWSARIVCVNCWRARWSAKIASPESGRAASGRAARSLLTPADACRSILPTFVGHSCGRLSPGLLLSCGRCCWRGGGAGRCSCPGGGAGRCS